MTSNETLKEQIVAEFVDKISSCTHVGGFHDCVLDNPKDGEAYQQRATDFLCLALTKMEEHVVRDTLGKVLALKVNMPSEREYSTNPTSAYRSGFEESVSMYRGRIRILTQDLPAKPDEHETDT